VKPDLSLRPGQYHQHYLILATLGIGGMSEVYLAYDFQNARLVALKRLSQALAENSRILRSFMLEGEFLQRLEHPSILRIFELVQEQDGTAQMVLEYVHGQHLGRLLRSSLQLPLRTVVRILEDVAGGLSLAHRGGVVHRDVKPQNIIWKTQGRAVVIDFGIAQSDRPEEAEARLDALGTLAYASPEQRQGAELDARSDIWSLGAVFYQLLTGKRVIPRGERRAMLHFRSDGLAPPSSFRRDLPRPLERLCLSMLEDHVEERLGSLTKVLVELGKLRLSLSEEARYLVFGDEVDHQLDLAYWSWDQGEFERAREILKEVGKGEDPEARARIFQLRARFMLQEGRPQRARKQYLLALEETPLSLDLYLELGTLLLRQAKFDLVEEVLDRAPERIQKAGQLVVLRNVCRQLPLVPVQILEAFGFEGVAVQLQRGISRKTEDRSQGLSPEPVEVFETARGFSTAPGFPGSTAPAEPDASGDK
jgi:serine/threonine protein kinase